MKTLQHSINGALLGLLLLFLPLVGAGQKTARAKAAEAKTVFEYLAKEEAVKMTLEMDFTTILENRKKDQYYPATLIDANGKSFRIEVKLRGKYRRKIAEIPPLKLKFKKKDLLAQGLDSLNEIKLVLPAYENDLGNELVVKEYLIYRMFEKLTSASVRARLVRLTIHDQHVEQTRKVYAIMVEDEEETTARMNGELVEQYGISPDSLISHQAALVSVFEYMIGNTDWDIAMMRNVRLIKSPETGKILVVPYDFDFAGLVNAPYATPSSDSGLRSVRDRFMMANGIKTEHLKRAIKIIRAAKDDLYSICRNRYLSGSTSDQMIDYLESFFQQVEERDDVPTIYKMPPTD